jgi:hypothetical protein
MKLLHGSDFSRAHIEEHYEHFHPKQWALYNRALSEKGQSAETNNEFFKREKITAHFARRDLSMDVKVVSKPFGYLATLLYAREEDHAARTATCLALRRKPSRQGRDDSSSCWSSDSSSDDCEDEGVVGEYVARLLFRATFPRVIDLVSIGLLFNQVALVASQERPLSRARSLLSNVKRRDVTVNNRLIAVLGLEAVSRVMRRSWAFFLAAHAPTQILGTAYICVRARFPPLAPHKDISNLHIVASPMRASYTGESMYEVTAKLLDALDESWRSKIISATSDGAANMVVSVCCWQTRLRNASAAQNRFI